MTNSRVNFRFTNMAKSFGEQLQEQLRAKGMRPAELARRSGITKQGIGRLLNNTPHTITGALPKPELDTVDKIARALNWDLSEARVAAGYAPIRSNEVEMLLVRFQHLSPDIQRLAQRTIKAVLDVFVDEESSTKTPNIERDDSKVSLVHDSGELDDETRHTRKRARR